MRKLRDWAFAHMYFSSFFSIAKKYSSESFGIPRNNSTQPIVYTGAAEIGAVQL